MNRHPLVRVTVFLAAVVLGADSPCAETLDFVDPMIGTQTGVGEGGGMMPMTGAPFGSIQWVPMTRRTEVGRVSFECAGMTNFLGIIATRQPAICMGDWGHFSLMPRTGAVECDFAKRGLPSSMKGLRSTPYRTEVAAGGIRTVFSATSRAALMRIDYPKDAPTPHLVIDASRDYVHGWSDKSPKDGFLEIGADNRSLVGWNSDRLDAHHSYPLPNFKGWFVMEFSRPFVGCGTYAGAAENPPAGRYRSVVRQDGKRYVRGDVAGGWLEFAPSDDPLVVRIGVSLISAERARENLRREIAADETVDRLAAKMKDVWRRQLGRISISTADENVRTIFCTGLYRASLYPREIGEYGRYYSPFDDKVHEGDSYTCYSGWDTYRAEHPLLTFLAPERVDGMMRALVQAYEEGGWLPKWPNPGYTGIMVGGPAEVMLAEAHAKGFRGFDVRKAYEAVRKNATVPQSNDRDCTWKDRGLFGEFPETRAGLSWYQELGYVPCDKVYESVSRTQDFSFDDTAAAVLAEAVGAKDDAVMFRRRAHSWTNVWCAAKQMCLPRDAAGNWCDPKSGFGWHYTECIPETALWCVPHDVSLLSRLLGGDAAFVARLDRFFEENFFTPDRWRLTVHGNEPSHHVAYLYNRVGRPDRTQERVREILSRCYSVSHQGFDGNEDCGQMSAWYVFSALGFYPVEPQSGEYEVGSPVVDAAEIRIGAPYAPVMLKIVVRNQSPTNKYVNRVFLNGRRIYGTRLRHADLVKGGELVFEMSPEPDATPRIQKAIDEAWKAGGGTVEVDRGVHHIKGLRLRSNVTLRLRSGAVLLASRDCTDYDAWKTDALEPVPEPDPQSPHKYFRNWFRGIIRLQDVTNAAIVGEPGSVIDGANSYDPDGEEHYRGAHGITAVGVTNCVFRGYTMRRTGNWAHHFRLGKGLSFEDVTIEAGHDGIHLRACDDVNIGNCTFRTGDDAIAGFDNADIHVHDCDISSACSAFRFGGRRVLIERCKVHGPCDYPWRGSLDKALLASGDGDSRGEGRRNTLSLFTYFSMKDNAIRQNAREIVLRDLEVNGADRFLQYNYFGNEVWSRGVPLESIRFENVSARGIKLPLCAYGAKDCPLELRLENCRLSFDGTLSELVRGANFKVLGLRDVAVEGVDGTLLRNYGPSASIEVERVEGVDPKEERAAEPFKVKSI